MVRGVDARATMTVTTVRFAMTASVWTSARSGGGHVGSEHTASQRDIATSAFGRTAHYCDVIITLEQFCNEPF